MIENIIVALTTIFYALISLMEIHNGKKNVIIKKVKIRLKLSILKLQGALKLLPRTLIMGLLSLGVSRGRSDMLDGCW